MKRVISVVLLVILSTYIISGCTNKVDKEDINSYQVLSDDSMAINEQSKIQFNKSISVRGNENYITSGLEELDSDCYLVEPQLTFTQSNSEEYLKIYENGIKSVSSSPLSTFSIDVDTASYSNIRRYLNDGIMPPADAVRIEEMINYFNYNYKEPENENPFSVNIELGECPWNKDHYLAMIGLKGRELEKSEKNKTSNLVFLLDVSGSMDSPDKLPLLKSAFKMLTEQLGENDRVSIVVYAGASGVVLEGARGDQKEKIFDALNSLNAGGSTAGGEGINLAYKIAKDYFVKGGNNRVILATDGDFNVGASSVGELENLIENKRKEGVFLSVLGFGTGNTKDNKMETLADKGDGNYAYIDSILEAKKVLVSEMGSTLYTIAKDVKIQVEFNPTYIKGYRLIGYENRLLENRDFNDDTKDAGEIGAGHTVTAFYEIIPAGSDEAIDEDLRYSKGQESLNDLQEVMYIKLRYKKPDEENSVLITEAVSEKELNIKNNSNDFKFASSVAELGLLLRESSYADNASFEGLIDRAKASKGIDEEGYRSEFIRLAETAQMLK